MSSIKRKPHVLKSEKTLAIPRHLLFFDTETKEERIDDGTTKHILKLGYACYYRREYGRHVEKVVWKDYYTEQAFWDFVFSHCEDRQRLWCIARNVTYDFTVLKGWKYLGEAGYKLKFFHNQGTCAIISVTCKRKTLVFLDSMNWFSESLAKTGERIGIPKMEIDFKTCTLSELKEYCKNDVRIEFENFKIFIRFLEHNKIARLCYTKGSTAMSAFLLRHYTTKIYIHNNEQAINLERAAYKGGRVECFYLGDLNNDNYYLLDVNSLYPYVMRNNLYPVKYERILHRCSIDTLKDLDRDKSIVAKVLVETDEPVYAVKRARTVFPIGRFWVSLCTPELQYARLHGHLKAVDVAVVYEQENIFKSYVDKFYDLRSEFKRVGVQEYEELCKYMLNTLYGKFGQRGEEWVKIGECPDEPDRAEEIYYPKQNRRGMLRYLLGEVFELRGHGESFDSFPAIAAHVTAYGRMYLYELMKQAGYGNYFYCDTDSLMVNEAGICRLNNKLDKVALGGLKVENTATTVVLRGLKDYTFSDKCVIKGVRKTARMIETGVYEQEKWASFRGILRSGQANTYTVKTVTKHLNREYTKGTLNLDGTLSPFVFADSLHAP